MVKHQRTPDGPTEPTPKKRRKMTTNAVNTAARRRKAVDLKAAGKTHQEIADELGYANKGTISRVIRETVAKADVESVAHLLNVMAGDLVHHHHTRALGRDGRPASLKHGRLFWQGYGSMARVMGHEAAQKIDHSGHITVEGMTDEQLERLRRTGDVAAAMASGSGAGDPATEEAASARGGGEDGSDGGELPG